MKIGAIVKTVVGFAAVACVGATTGVVIANVVEKVKESKCPDDCTKCVDICPHKALTGKRWNIDTLRSELIDYHLCNQKRSAYIEKHGRKNSCGLCMAVCPF